jgi:dienelactone hydrolase
MESKKQIIELKREFIKGDGFNVPTVILTPINSHGAAVVVHGYGGCKEESLGLAWRIAEKGFTTGAIDLRGHGEHSLDLDENILLDLETAISYFQSFGNVTAVGHSLGGRLSLISSADFAIGISPALSKAFSPQTQGLIKQLRDHRVHKSSYPSIFDILGNLPSLEFDDDKALLIYGSLDVPEVMSECRTFKSEGFPVTEINQVLHGDSFLVENTFHIISDKMREWYK